jgi:hypothetical protein
MRHLLCRLIGFRAEPKYGSDQISVICMVCLRCGFEYDKPGPWVPYAGEEKE